MYPGIYRMLVKDYQVFYHNKLSQSLAMIGLYVTFQMVYVLHCSYLQPIDMIYLLLSKDKHFKQKQTWAI